MSWPASQACRDICKEVGIKHTSSHSAGDTDHAEEA